MCGPSLGRKSKRMRALCLNLVLAFCLGNVYAAPADTEEDNRKSEILNALERLQALEKERNTNTDDRRNLQPDNGMANVQEDREEFNTLNSLRALQAALVVNRRNQAINSFKRGYAKRNWWCTNCGTTTKLYQQLKCLLLGQCSATTAPQSIPLSP